MIKKTLIIFFLISFCIAIYTFITRDNSTLRESIEKRDGSQPRVELFNFISKRYEDSRQFMEVKAEKAEFYYPNLIELKGKFSGWQSNLQNARNQAAADSVQIYFAGNSVVNILSEPSVETVYFKGNVRFKNPSEILITDFAKYAASAKLIESDKPVKVMGKGHHVRGEDGFIYNFDREELRLHGRVDGSFLNLNYK